MCLNEAYSKVWIGEHMSYTFTLNRNNKTLYLYCFFFALTYATKKG
jgi:hypothetical protein